MSALLKALGGFLADLVRGLWGDYRAREALRNEGKADAERKDHEEAGKIRDRVDRIDPDSLRKHEGHGFRD